MQLTTMAEILFSTLPNEVYWVDHDQLNHKTDNRNKYDTFQLHLGREAIVELLLENGANPNSVNHAGESALHIAAKNGNFISLHYFFCGHN